MKNEINIDIFKLLDKTHIENVPENNLSKKLGLKYIEIFYKLILESKNSKILYTLKNNEIESSAILITNYNAFNKEMIKNTILQLVLDVIRLNVSVTSIFDRINKIKNEKKAFKILSNNCHLGFFFANKNFKPDSAKALIKNINKLNNCALEKNFSNIWTVVNCENIKAKKFLIKLGYDIFYENQGEIYVNKNLK